MATELNHDTIKAAIVTLLTAGEPNAVFDSSGGTDKLRSITVGYALGGDPLEDKQRNYAFVTNNVTLESNRVVGTEADAGNNKAIEHTMRYDIHVVIFGEQGRDAEKNLDTIQKGILELLEADQDIGGTVDGSFPERVIVLRPNLTLGKAKQGRIITIKAVKTTGA